MPITLKLTKRDQARLSRLNVMKETLADTGHDYTGETVFKPWGHEVEIYRTAQSCAWCLSMDPTSETSMHCHTQKTAVFFLSEGDLVVETLNGNHAMYKGDMLVIEPGVFHRAKTEEGAVLIEVESPPNKNDIVRLEDRYGREGKPYDTAWICTEAA